MTKPLDKWISWYTRRDRRERLLLMGVVVIALALLGHFVLLVPQKDAIKSMQQANEDRRIELSALQDSIRTAEQDVRERNAHMSTDQAELDRLKQRIAEAEEYYSRGEAGSPRSSLQLRDLLKAGHGVAITSLNTLPPVAFQLPARDAAQTDGKEAAKSDAPEKLMYKYGAEITLKGNYTALENYLRKLEASPVRLFWASANLNANYPQAELRLTVYALSDQPRTALQ